MLYFEDDNILDEFITKTELYEATFKVEFPIFEHVNGEITADSADKVFKLIDKAIETNTPVEIPDGYHERKY